VRIAGDMARSASDSLRRAVDVVAGVVGLAVALPVLAAVSVLVRVRMGPGVVFRQRRLGRGGHPFALLKFRTMRHATPGREAPEFDAERLTALGRWLRSTSLDELPSLVNLVRGDITLVGPRPLPLHYWDRFRGEEYRRFEVKPGITGLAQINGRNTVDWPERLAFDVRYVRERSLLGDARILLRTVPAVLRRHGVDQDGGVTMYELPADRPPPPEPSA
jgi:lipopolysaccharide/colanic/teichoic acid biosynthesis glycosyltransferase